ncbi:proprotein convertase type 2 [Caerostris darwini]|uniref:Proprotein convertase type 2 n=1 Tax=Caerostris darwini TaxID=1538125 RepID=A0AAV4UVY5_9ARAC|nr:proprotein convertase type 2 [Caerostris darwini]
MCPSHLPLLCYYFPVALIYLKIFRFLDNSPFLIRFEISTSAFRFCVLVEAINSIRPNARVLKRIKQLEVLGSSQYFQFVHRAMPHARKKRSVPHMKILKNDPLVARATQQTGFKRVKRGYKQLRLREEMAKEMREPTDPYFPYQWYLVSGIRCLSISGM